jgi:hypothetical protein
VPPVVKSESAGLVQEMVTCVSPADAVTLVAAAGDALSIVTIALSVSVPAVELVAVMEVTVAVTA